MTWSTRPETRRLLRPLWERIVQTLAYELTGLVLVLPAYRAVTGHSTTESAALLAAIALACLIAGPLHNLVYDRIDLRRTGHPACQRGAAARLRHAISHEIALTAASIPILMGLGGHGLWEAIALDAGLTLFYVLWAALFYNAWDRVRPLVPRARSGPAPDPPRITPL